MKRIDVNEKLSKLGINENIVEKFSKYNIVTIDDLWNLKRKDLKEMEFSSEQINHIIIKMQLNGIDLNRKKY